MSNDKGHGFSLDQQILLFKRALHSILMWVTDNLYKKLKLIKTKEPTNTECLMESGAGEWHRHNIHSTRAVINHLCLLESSAIISPYSLISEPNY